MRDVARLAGVAVSTVSAVVNHKGVIGSELTERVERAVEALGYRPHAAARGLRLGRTYIIGMVIPDVTNPFFVEVLRGVEDEALRNGYEVMVCDSNGEPNLEMNHLTALYAQRVDGVLLIPADSYVAHSALVRCQLPIVFVDCVPMRAEVMSVVIDNFDASYGAVRYLLGLGHQRIALISGKLVHSTSVDRVEGYRKAMQKANLPVREDYIRHGESHIESGYSFGLSLLKSSPPPTAIFTMNNRTTLGVLRALKELAIPCPGRISLMGFDDCDWTPVFNPSLTAIAQPSNEIGKNAVQLLLQSIQSVQEGVKVETRQIVLKSSLRIRESTGPPPNA